MVLGVSTPRSDTYAQLMIKQQLFNVRTFLIKLNKIVSLCQLNQKLVKKRFN